MIIKEPDFILKQVSDDSNLYDLTFMKKVKKRDTGNYEIEPGDTLYGLSLSSVLNRIIKHRTAKKYTEDNITLKQYLKELNVQYNELLNLCKENNIENRLNYES